MTQIKISFCTVCMNRLHHLKETLPKNIIDNSLYSNLEFIVLDYNSSDGMEEWIKTNFFEEIKSGILIYLRTNDPESFSQSHSRNMIYRYARGEVICNVDADNYTGKDFALFINKEFNENRNIFLTASLKFRGAFGRVCFLNKDFFNTNGYDESMVGYGWEDIDFRDRLMLLGRTQKIITNPSFLKAIQHEKAESIENEFLIKNLFALKIAYNTHYSSILLFLLKDGSFKSGTIVDRTSKDSHDAKAVNHSSTKLKLENTLNENWFEGKWEFLNNDLHLNFSNSSSIILRSTDSKSIEFYDEENLLKYYKIQNRNLIISACALFSQNFNAYKVFLNRKYKRIRVNNLKSGSGEIFVNFDSQNPIKFI